MASENKLSFETNQTLFNEGDKTTEMFIITSGNVAVYKNIGIEDRILLAELGPGAMIGEMSLISGAPRSATAIAKTETIVRVVTREIFTRSSAGIPTWAFGIANALIERLRRINMIIKKNAQVANLEKKQDIVFIEDFTIEYNEIKNPHLAYIKGYFTASDVPAMTEFIRKIIQQKRERLCLDFSDVIDLDAESQKYLKQLNDQLKRQKIEFTLQNIQLVHHKFEQDSAIQEVISIISPPRQNIAVGEYIIRQDEESRNLFIIKSGRFEITREVGGKTVRIAEIGAGNVIGEMALIAGSKRSASVRAIKPSIIHVIEPADIHTNKFNIPQWFVRIIQQLITRIANSNQILDKIVRHEKLNKQILGIELDVLPDASKTGHFLIRGELNLQNRFLLKNQLVKLINNGFIKILLDFKDITEMDKNYISTFNLISASLISRGGRLLFVNTSAGITRMLKDGIIYTEDDVYQDALPEE